MYKFRVEQCRDEQFLTKLITQFKSREVRKYRKLQEYYDVRTDILKRTMDSGKPNNRIAHGFARYITNMATSYFAGNPVRYKAEDENYQEALLYQLNSNYINSINFETSKEASKKGIGYMLLFLDEDGLLRIRKCDAETILPVYSPRLGEFLECAIRLWEEYDIDGNLIAEQAALYDSHDMILYRKKAGDSRYRMIDAESHMFQDIPVIVVWNNEEITGDYAPHIPLMDAYDKSQSDTANDMEYFTDAYLCISGASDLTEDAGTNDTEDANRQAANLRKNRILYLDEKGQAEWLVKNINDTAVENYKNRLYSDLFFLSQVPALTDESFAGNLTGIAIKYKLIGLEELAIMKQNKFEAAQKKLIKLVTDYINLTQNKQYDAEAVTTQYERNLVMNDAELIENARNVEGIVSRETQLNMLPVDIVSSPQEEKDRILQEQAELEGLPYVKAQDLESGQDEE